MLVGLFVVLDFIIKKYVPSKLNIQLLYVFASMFGVLFGKWKGPVAAIISDTAVMLIKGMIHTWMIEYALVWPIVAWFAAMVFENFEKRSVLFPISIFAITTGILTIFLIFIHSLHPNSKVNYLGFELTYQHILTISVLIFLTLWVVMFTSAIFNSKERRLAQENNRRPKNFYKNLCFSIATLTFVYVVFRWSWEPYIFNLYLQRFTDSSRIITPTRYLTVLSGIIVKSLVVFPFTITVFAVMLEVLLIFRKKYQAKQQRV